MDDQTCPRCKTTKYRNPSLVLMVNICGHALCESCVDLLFLKGAGSCPECNVPLRRSNFRVQLFEDAMVEKEVDIRKRVLRDFNKREEDFDSLRSYNDYLEEVETIVYNLANNIDVVNTNRRIEQYKKENRDQILKAKGKRSREEVELETLIEIEKTQEEARRRDLTRIQEEERKKKLRDKEALIDELMFSTEDAKNIVESFAQQQKQVVREEVEVRQALPPQPRVTQFSTGIEFGKTGSFLPTVVEEGRPFVYEAPSRPSDGPAPPDWQQLEEGGYLRHVRAEADQERAAGFRANIACLRALQEALVGLYHVSERSRPLDC